MPAQVVRLHNVGKQYKDGRYALRNLSFDVREGEFLFITGVSGAGKSTLLKLLFGMEKPSEGHAFVNNQDITKLRKRSLTEYRRKVGFVFQDFKLLPDLTVFENISLPLDIRRLSPGDMEYRAKGVLSLVGLSDRAKDFPSNLSGGEQQRVAIARSVITRPNLLLADEPTGNLDRGNARGIMELFREICGMGTTVCVATHDEFLLNEFPSRTIELEDGIVKSDTEANTHEFILPNSAKSSRF